MNERPPNQDELRDLEQLVQEGIECLGFIVALPSNLDDSAAVVRAVRQFVDEVRQGTPLPRAYRDLEQAAYALGTLWGDELRRAFKWEWVYLQADNGFEGWTIVSPNRSHACFPHRFIFGKLAKPESDNTIALLFNMIKAGRVPSSSPGKYLTLG
jgi:hypothetical protein